VRKQSGRTAFIPSMSSIRHDVLNDVGSDLVDVVRELVNGYDYYILDPGSKVLLGLFIPVLGSMEPVDLVLDPGSDIHDVTVTDPRKMYFDFDQVTHSFKLIQKNTLYDPVLERIVPHSHLKSPDFCF